MVLALPPSLLIIYIVTSSLEGGAFLSQPEALDDSARQCECGPANVSSQPGAFYPPSKVHQLCGRAHQQLQDTASLRVPAISSSKVKKPRSIL